MLTDVEVLVGVAVLNVPEEDEASLVQGLRRDVGCVPSDSLDGALVPHDAGSRRGDIRAEHDVDVANVVRVEDLSRGGGRCRGEDGEDSSELGRGEHDCTWYGGKVAKGRDRTASDGRGNGTRREGGGEALRADEEPMCG